uniref:Tail fiber protein n=1 Tax=Salmonella phage vB_SEnST11_KE23 TaxID=3161174 RepID=A0AAU8GF05_9CAUD
MADYNDKVVNAELILPEGGGVETFVDDGQFHTEDTTTVTLLGNGNSTTPLKATVVVDPASGNALVAGPDGLSVGVSSLSDNLLVLAGGKLYVAPPQIVVPISTKTGNVLVEVTDSGEEGLFVPPGEKGDKGDKGDQGDPGVGIYIQGIIGDPSQLPPAATMQEGDTYVIGTHYWTVVKGTWADLGDFSGPQGQDGIGLVIKGAFADTALLPTQDNTEGDTYIIQDQMWVWTGDADGWQPVGQVGPQGPQGIQGPVGPQGPQGIQGPQGYSVLSKGTVATYEDLGSLANPQQGWVYGVRTGGYAGFLFMYSGTQWVALGNFTGPTGPQGPQGAKGDKGNDAAIVKLKGTKATTDDLPDFGNAVADAWVVQTDNHVWVWTSDDTWEDIGPVQGPKGDQGDEGPQGPVGPRGLQGPEGATGPQGPAGAEGPQGLQGPQGEKGDKGDQGLTGPVGPQGPIGPKGDRGETGYGARVLGTKGAVSDLPATGTPGDAWVIVPNLYVWSQADAQWINVGPYVGPKGDKGDKGDTGDVGPKGDTGADGPQGPKGDTGDEGPQGPTGDTGPQGPMGVSLTARGTVADQASLPSGAATGDLYTTEDTGEAFAFDGTNWVNLGVMRGPQGDAGIQGDQGPMGASIVAKGVIATYEDLLDVQNPEQGWLYSITSGGNKGYSYVYSGTDWEPLGDLTGPEGPQGPQGPEGQMGAGVEILGKLDNTTELPSTGELGQGYLISGDFWGWTGTTYENLGPIQGPKGDVGPQGQQGPQGIQGIQGVKGDQGTLWLNFARNPGPADGRIGDYFINKSTLEYFQKTSATAWASLGYMGGGNVYDTSSTTPQARTSSGWVDVPVLEAPADTGYYVRVDNAWKRLDRYDLLVTSTTGAMDVSASQVFTVDGTASKSMSFANLPVGRAMTIVIVFSGSGASLTWPSSLSWSNGVAPVLGATRTVVTVLWDGTNLTGTTSLTVA